MFVDTHAHLTAKDFESDLVEVVKRAREAGVLSIVVPGTDVETSRAAVRLAERFETVVACVGIHPHEAAKADDAGLQEIERLSEHPRVVAIGEIGLDYHYDLAPRERQREILSRQLAIARRRDLPVVIHSRESEEDAIRLVGESIEADATWRRQHAGEFDRFPPPRGVFHCFPGDVAMAWKVIRMGFYISMPGLVTFGNRPGKPNLMAEVAAKVSAEHILLETDSPYLAPIPHRGKRNEPSHIPLIAAKIAELQGLSIEDIARTSSFGAHRLFGIGSYPEPTFAYTLRDSLYLNITIRCNADCVFCDRKGEAIIKGHNLRITKEPDADEIIARIGDPIRYREIVFCGYGEPTIRLEVVKTVSKWVKAHGGAVRLNTDGHGNIINHRNIVPELVGTVDAVSISLNSTDPEQYGSLMRLDGRKYFPAMVEFARECVKHRFDVTMTIVDLTGTDEARARLFVEKEIGAKFKNRPYF